MDKWLRRAVGSAGVLGAVLALGAGTAAVRAAATPVVAPAQPASDSVPPAPDALHPVIDGPNMIGDDYVDQSPYASQPLATVLDAPFTTGPIPSAPIKDK
jgi:hypothetical protein